MADERTRTWLVLDGFTDPTLAADLSKRWHAAGFDNAVDVAGQCAWIASMDNATADLTEDDVDRAAAIARAYGIELRDRSGKQFVAANDLASLREKVTHEYKSRFATALVYGLPAIGLHYLAPVLSGGADTPRDMLYPWLIQFLLVGWLCIAAGWPILWQGALAAIHLRVTGDLLTSLLMLALFVPSAVGLATVPFADEPWLSLSPGPAFHATFFVIALATLQRWLAHRRAGGTSGKADWMIERPARVLGGWLALSAVLAIVATWVQGTAIAMLMPPLIALGAVNRLAAGASAVLPVFAFAALMVFGPGAFGLQLEGMQYEVAAGFQLIVVLSFAMGWRGVADATR